MHEKVIPILKKDGDIAITAIFFEEIHYAVKVGKELILKKAKLQEEKK